MNSIAEKIYKKFKKKFTTQPKIYFSPGRINLIGEHIDYNDGYVMPAAINKGIYFAVAANSTNVINFYAFDFNAELSININDITNIDGWKSYVLSVVNEFKIANKNIGGFDCVFGGDIPRGSGISSSAAVEGGLAFALNDIFNCNFDSVELALLCQSAEHNYPNVKCGIMDMYANLNGKKDHVLLIDCKKITHQYFPLQLTDYCIVLLNTKVHHSLASGEYNVRIEQCQQGLAILQEAYNINSFRDITSVKTIEENKTKMTTKVFNCCKYVVEEILRTQKAASLLHQNNIIEFGKLMFQTHEGLSKLYNVSCAELDFLVDKAKLNADVVGARLMGGGFGGCTINIVKKEGVNNFIKQSTIDYKKQFNIDLENYIVETCDGTDIVNYTFI